MTLDQLPIQHPAVIKSIEHHDLAPKLIEMGIVPGRSVLALFRAPFSGPMAIDLDGYTLSLRVEEAQLVNIDFA